MEQPLRELRRYRELRKRRDRLIRKASKDGGSVGQIAAASGLTHRRVQEILRDGSRGNLTRFSA